MLRVGGLPTRTHFAQQGNMLARRIHRVLLRHQQQQRQFAALVTTVALPDLQELDVHHGGYRLKYLDAPRLADEHATDNAINATTPTIVLLHGAPGTTNDFKHLIPLLRRQARVIALNLPGNGGSVVLEEQPDDYYSHLHAHRLADAAYDAVTQLCDPSEQVFVLGHSFGGHTAINLAALHDQAQSKASLNLRGIGLLSSAGLHPHKAFFPRSNMVSLWMLRSQIKLLQTAAERVARLAYTKLLKFPARFPTEHFVAGIVRCATTDFQIVRDQVASLPASPTFFAWACDDAIIEEELFQELSEAMPPGVRISFQNGGHNIQKTRADVVADHLLQWMRDVITGHPTAVAARSREIVSYR